MSHDSHVTLKEKNYTVGAFCEALYSLCTSQIFIHKIPRNDEYSAKMQIFPVDTLCYAVNMHIPT